MLNLLQLPIDRWLLPLREVVPVVEIALSRAILVRSCGGCHGPSGAKKAIRLRHSSAVHSGIYRVTRCTSYIATTQQHRGKVGVVQAAGIMMDLPTPDIGAVWTRAAYAGRWRLPVECDERMNVIG